MKIIMPGGVGHLGNILARAFTSRGYEVTVLSRHGPQKGEWPILYWDGETMGPWTKALDGADAVVNLAGRSVNCRYNRENRRQIMDSRVNSTKIIGRAIAAARRPPPVWVQMSTATVYAHRYDAANDEYTGIIGGSEPDAPDTWRFSTEVVKAWEAAMDEVMPPGTRGVKVRLAMVMSPEPGCAFDMLLGLVRCGFGGQIGNGKQYHSWIHETDFVNAMELLINSSDLSGPVNVCAPHPIPNKEFMRALRQAWGAPFGLSIADWMLELGAIPMQTESELILKSRRVACTKLLQNGFQFTFPNWQEASGDLCQSWRALRN
jgi:uncharacterized protein (TIGR01777 family)